MSFRGKVWMCIVLILACFWLAVGIVVAAPLDEYAEDWRNGQALPEMFDEFYARSSNRQISFKHIQEFDGRIDAYYEVSADMGGERRSEVGVASYYIENEKVVRVEYSPIGKTYLIDMAYAGQAADVISTGVGLAVGLTEANPIFADVVGSTGGLLAVGALKTGLVYAADQQGLATCASVRTALSTFGWGAAAWNVGMILGGIPAAAVAGLIGGYTAYGIAYKEAPVRCIAPN